MKPIRAHFDGQVFIPDEPVDLPAGTSLTLRVEIDRPPKKYMTGKELAESDFVGIWRDRDDIGDSTEFARELRRRAERRDDR